MLLLQREAVQLTWLALVKQEGGLLRDPSQRAGKRTAALFVKAASGLANAWESLTNHANFRVYMIPPLIMRAMCERENTMCLHTPTHMRTYVHVHTHTHTNNVNKK